MFFKFDRDRSGALEKREVLEAVHSLGMKVMLITASVQLPVNDHFRL